MPSPIVHFQFTSSNPQKTAQYFQDVFDWKIEPGRAGAAAFIDTGASQVIPNDIFLGGSIRTAPEGLAPGTNVYVRVADLDATLLKAVEHGGAIVMPRRDSPGAPTIALIRTPDDVVVGLVQL
jgi:predicted enzyme related to lactoylglutathione lyase